LSCDRDTTFALASLFRQPQRIALRQDDDADHLVNDREHAGRDSEAKICSSLQITSRSGPAEIRADAADVTRRICAPAWRRFKVQRARQALDEPAPDGIGSDNARLPGRPATFTDQDASAEDKTGSVRSI